MREGSAFEKVRAAAAPFAFVCASFACLAAGGLLAAAQHGILRTALGGGGFAAYVFLFGRALGALGLSQPGAS